MTILAIIFFGFGCTRTPLARPQPARPIEQPNKNKTTTTQINQSVTRLEYPFPEPSSGQIILYQIDPAAFTWRFEHAATPKTIDAWAASLPEAAFILNGVYFHEDNLPSGWLATRGEEIGIRQFDLNRSSILSLSPSVEIVQSKLRNIDLGQFQEAAQSYPIIIEGGSGAIEKDTNLYAARSFFGTDVDGRVYLGITRNTAVSLFMLMEQLLKTGVKWNDVLNLDGGPSSGLMVKLPPHVEQLDNFTLVPNVIVAVPK